MLEKVEEHVIPRRILTALLLCGLIQAQTKASPPKNNTPKTSPPVFEINLSEVPEFGTLPWTNEFAPGQGGCGDSSLYVWRWPPAQGLVAFTPKGIVPFLSSQMTDIPTPSARSAFISDSIVYVEADSIENPEEKVETLEDDEGRKLTRRRVDGKRHKYLAQFDKDGKYKSSLKFDLPFDVYTLAAFESGTLVVQGMDENKIPRIARLDASGQLIRYLNLEKDMTAVSEIPKSQLNYGGDSADPGVIAMTSHFIASNKKILFLRAMASTRVYEIQESGEIRVVKIKAPEGYDPEELIASDKNWLIRFRKPDPNGTWSNAWHSLFEVDPNNGELLKEYRVKASDTADQVYCFMDDEFWALRNQDGKLTVARGGAAPYRGN
jgi:hypothetical protein